MIPTRFSGSHAERRTISPRFGSRRVARSDSTASGVRELLADEAADEAAAAQLAAHLEAAVDAHEIAPRRRLRLAREQIAEHDAVAPDVLAGQRLVPRLVGQPRSGLSSGSGAGAPGDRSSDQRPAPTAPAPVRRFQRACQRARAPPRVCVAEISARRPEKPSPVTRPAETSSPSASSTSARRRRVPAMISSRKLAPVARQERERRRAPARDRPSSSAGKPASGASSQGRSARRTSAIGAARLGVPPAGRARQPPPGDAAREAERVEPAPGRNRRRAPEGSRAPRRRPPPRSPEAGRSRAPGPAARGAGCPGGRAASRTGSAGSRRR